MALIGTKGPKAEKPAKEAKAPKPTKTKAPAPVRAKSTGGVYVGLDIGTHSIKVVEVKGFKSGLTVTGFGIAPTPPGSIAGGMIGDPKLLGNAIKQLLQKSGIKGRRVVSAAAGSEGVVVRVIEVAASSAAELKDMMKFEIERHIPFAASDVEISYQKLDDDTPRPDTEEGMMDVLLAVARRDMVSYHLNTLEAAGLTAAAIDVEPLAVGRALIDLSKQGLASKNVVLVNIGETLTDVGVYKNGILRFPRTIPIAGENFTRAISDSLGIELDQAETEKITNATVLMELIGRGGDVNPFGDPAESSPFDFDFGDSVAGTPPAPAATPFDPFSVGPPTPPAAAPASGEFNPFTVGTPTTPPPASGSGEFNPFTVGEPEPPQAAAFDAFGNPLDPNDPFAQPAPATPAPAASANPFDYDYDTAGTTPAAEPTAAPEAVAIVPQNPVNERQRELFNALLPVLSEFAMEVRRSVDYFRSRYPEEIIDQVVLCGGGARLGNLNQYVEYEMGIPTIIGDPLGNALMGTRNTSSERVSDISPSFAVALGLAARDAVVGI